MRSYILTKNELLVDMGGIPLKDFLRAWANLNMKYSTVYNPHTKTLKVTLNCL